MIDLRVYVPDKVLLNLTSGERDYLATVLKRFDGYPSLIQIWDLIDEAWDALDCDPNHMDKRVTDFYRHPVWILNGLFSEQETQSLANRLVFKDWVAKKRPKRVADFGGGFGSLARFVGLALPSTQIDVVEPHPHPAAIAMAVSLPNVHFVSELTGQYDLLIATDVFEHVPDPLGLCADTAGHLRAGGQYLIANCFQPVIKCHLPQLFHLEYGWHSAMIAMGLEAVEQVGYGYAYGRKININLPAARKIDKCARSLYPLIRALPKGRVRIGKFMMKYFCEPLIR